MLCGLAPVCFFIAQNSVVMTFVAFSIASFSQIISAGSCSWLGNNFWLDCVFAGVIVSQRGLERGFGLVASGGAVRLPTHILFGLWLNECILSPRNAMEAVISGVNLGTTALLVFGFSSYRRWSLLSCLLCVRGWILRSASLWVIG